jgi:hypothetical protein
MQGHKSQSGENYEISGRGTSQGTTVRACSGHRSWPPAGRPSSGRECCIQASNPVAARTGKLLGDAVANGLCVIWFREAGERSAGHGWFVSPTVARWLHSDGGRCQPRPELRVWVVRRRLENYFKCPPIHARAGRGFLAYRNPGGRHACGRQFGPGNQC